MRNKALGIGLAVALALSSSGCFLRFVLAAREVQTITEEIDLIVDAVLADSTVAVCRTNRLNVTECTYVVDGIQIASQSRLLSEFGIFGVVIDPLVLEVPAGTVVTGTFSGGGMSGDLLVYPSMSYVPIDDFQTLTPSPGKELVVVDLPPDAPVDGVDYSFRLTLQRVGPRNSGATEIKALATGRVRIGGKTFYPPMFPCVNSFDDAPGIRLASSSTEQPVEFLGTASGCDPDRHIYRFFNFPSACDLDNDQDVDVADINLIMDVRNRPAAFADPRDTNGDAVINANDARFCTTRCTRPQCAA